MPRNTFVILKSILIIGFLFLSLFGFSQIQADSAIFEAIKDDIAKKLPPLESLIDLAIANAPEIDLEELKATRAKYDIKTERRVWTEHIGIEGIFNYGHWFYNDRDELTRLNRFYLTESRRMNYGVGIYIKFPLYFLIDRKNNINKKKKELEIAMIQKDIKIKELRKKVIELYYELLDQQRKLKGSMLYQQASELMMQNATNSFLNGEIPPEEYNRQLDYKTRGDQAYGENVRLFNIAYVLLEEIVGVKFNLINTVK
jgi:outer membrane protein TolC